MPLPVARSFLAVIATSALWGSADLSAGEARTRSLRLGDACSMDLVRIEPGGFVMGVPEPVPLDTSKVDALYWLFCVSGGLLVLASVGVAGYPMLSRRKMLISLRRFMGVIVLLSCASYAFVNVHFCSKKRRVLIAEHEIEVKRHRYAHDEEKPAHPVEITYAFWLGKCEVTQGEWDEIMDFNPSQQKGRDLPVVNVSAEQVYEFLKKVSVATGECVDIPTEAEWEYACRAGGRSQFCIGDDPDVLDRIAWTGRLVFEEVKPVGTKEPNRWGLHDMLGNALEFCRGYREYTADLQVNPDCPSPCQDNTPRAFVFPMSLRGGSVLNDDLIVRVSARGPLGAEGADPFLPLGFRVVIREKTVVGPPHPPSPEVPPFGDWPRGNYKGQLIFNDPRKS